GLVLLEAMACGRGVIAAAAGAAPELVTLETGLLAPARDAGSLASTIHAFYQRDLDAMGRRARAHVERSYSWDIVMRGLLDVYRAVQNWQFRGTAGYVASWARSLRGLRCPRRGAEDLARVCATIASARRGGRSPRGDICRSALPL